MDPLYGDKHRILQQQFDTTRLADRVASLIVHDKVTDEEKAFIESRDCFFLSTIDHLGRPTCSYKGGDPGFVRVVDEGTLAFPWYDGNGMFYSAGNILGDPKIGILFIDFENPHRIRLQGNARIVADDPLMAEYHEAQFVVRVAITEMWVNCPRYIHPRKRLAASKYVPRSGCETPAPDWKHLEVIQDVLPAADLERVKREQAEGKGPVASAEEQIKPPTSTT